MSMISLEHITKQFGTGPNAVHAVQDVSLTVERGEIFGIIGYSGAGKSTLVRCINLLERPDKGAVKIDGKDITALSDKELRGIRKKIGMIFQHFNLLNSVSVFENVAAPLRNHTGLPESEVRARVEEMLALTGLTEKARAYPSQLSGGQKQRVAIARALSSRPDILLCDEATSALDPNTTQQILELISRLQKQLQLTVVMITHQMEVVKSICTKVAVMEEGRVAETGSLVNVFANPQSSIAKEFIAKTVYRAEAKETAKKLGRSLYQLTFVGEDANDPVITELVRSFPITVSILFGNLEKLGGVPFGVLVVDMQGPEESIAAAIARLKEQKILVEVIRHD